MSKHRELWYSHSKRALQQSGHFLPGDASTIGNRAALVDACRDAQRDGKISLNVDQMDCDCSRWSSGRILPAIPRLVERAVEEVYNDAEGPVYGLSIDPPEEKVKYTSRDLALEAFEDGHAHSVSMARYDEDGPY